MSTVIKLNIGHVNGWSKIKN